MQNSVASIQCSNLNCQAANPQDNKFCHKCRTPIVKRYLWAIGDWLKAYRVGELISDRYLLKQPQVILDTKPGLPPDTPDEIPTNLLPYLKLASYRLHIPQVYGYLPSPDEQMNLDIWLLEYGTIPIDSLGNLKYPQFLPELNQVWQEATALRQLNWLWQMARLWQPLQSRNVVSSLLNPSLLRVNGAIIQLLELQPDHDLVPSLPELGQFWSQWVEQAASSLKEFLEQLCLSLEEDKITQPEQLIGILDQAMLQHGHSQQRSYHIFTGTDSGPTRDHNEDACYPSSQDKLSIEEPENALAIVCDGIGGQDGGEIASQLAIETLVEEVYKLLFDIENWNPDRNTEALEQSIGISNDRISHRNDDENRQERQRMGTTLVMSFAHAHEMYLAHVGDSRIYWITPTSCHQVTVDDDLASREVRLGYLLYRDAIQYPNAGALVQALGMSSSANLHPTVQRLIIDEDCLFLLCSDGLSDYDRVDQYWESEIVPILNGDTDVATVGKRLIEIANQQNGHDNVTVALVHCQVKPKAETENISLLFPDIEDPDSDLSDLSSTEKVQEMASIMPTEQFSSSPTLLPTEQLSSPTLLPTEQLSSPTSSLRQPRNSLLFWLGIVFVLGLGGLVAYLISLHRSVNEGSINSNDVPILRPSLNSSPFLEPSPTLTSSPSLPSGDFIKVQKAIALKLDFRQSSDQNNSTVEVPSGTILQVVDQNQTSGLKLQVCSLPSLNTPSDPTVDAGWIQWQELEKSIVPNFVPSDEDFGRCNADQSPSF